MKDKGYLFSIINFGLLVVYIIYIISFKHIRLLDYTWLVVILISSITSFVYPIKEKMSSTKIIVGVISGFIGLLFSLLIGFTLYMEPLWNMM